MKKTFREKFKEAEAFDQVMMVSFVVITISFTCLMLVCILRVCGSI